MTSIQHLICGRMQVDPHPPAICHCLLLQEQRRLVLIDTGVGLQDVRHPKERLGEMLVRIVGFQLNEADTAVRQIERLGLSAADVTDIVLTHCDPDHTGGLADFPHARVHLSREEYEAHSAGNPRYLPAHFAHQPDFRPLESTQRLWFGLDARPVPLGLESEVLLISLPGHTLGHCGAAVQQGDRWFLHVGDAYYLRGETVTDDHPVSLLAAQRADDDPQRQASLAQIRRLLRDHSQRIEVCGYHDPSEFPETA